MNEIIAFLMRGGAWVPSVAIYNLDFGLDLAATVDHIEKLYRAGAEGVVINGTTGDGQILSHADKLGLIVALGRRRQEQNWRPDFVILTGTGTSNYAEAADIAHAASKEGFHGLLALPPREDGQYQFYCTLAEVCEALNIGLMLYHHPRLDVIYSVDPTVLGGLTRTYECVVGIKDSAGNLGSLPTWQQAASRPILTVCGDDPLIAMALKGGMAQAAIAGSANTARGLEALNRIFIAHRTGNDALLAAAQGEMDTEVQFLLTEGDGVFRHNARLYRLGRTPSQIKKEKEGNQTGSLFS